MDCCIRFVCIYNTDVLHCTMSAWTAGYTNTIAPAMRELWLSKCDPRSSQYDFFRTAFASDIESCAKRMAWYIINFFTDIGMVYMPFARSTIDGTINVVLARYRIPRDIDQDTIKIESSTFDKFSIELGHQSYGYQRPDWTDAPRARKSFMLLASPCQHPIIEYKEFPGEYMESFKPRIVFDHLKSIHVAEFPYNAVSNTFVLFGIEHLMLVFFMCAGDYIQHPCDVLYTLFISGDNAYQYLNTIWERIPEYRSRVCHDAFYQVLVFAEFFIPRIKQHNPDIVFAYINSIMKSLVRGLDIMLCNGNRNGAVHNIIRSHSSFLVSNLKSWVIHEKTNGIIFQVMVNYNTMRMRYLMNVNDAIVNSFESPSGVFLLKLFGLNVHELFSLLSVRGRDDISFTPDMMRTGFPLVIAMAYEIPDYSDAQYRNTSAAFIRTIRELCSLLFTQVSEERLVISGNMLLTGT